MKLVDILEELERVGDEATKAVYQRQGSGDNLFGVNYNHLNRIKKRINGFDNDLGLQLWNTGNLDAQSLATMIIDPSQITFEQLKNMAYELSFHQLCDIFVKNIVEHTPHMKQLFESWIGSDNLFVQRTAWQVLGKIAISHVELTDDYFKPYLDIIADKIRTSADIIKESMSTCLISIGLRNEVLEELVYEAEKKIGKLFNENTIFSFRYPSPSAYIQKFKEMRSLGERPY